MPSHFFISLECNHCYWCRKSTNIHKIWSNLVVSKRRAMWSVEFPTWSVRSSNLSRWKTSPNYIQQNQRSRSHRHVHFATIDNLDRYHLNSRMSKWDKDAEKLHPPRWTLVSRSFLIPRWHWWRYPWRNYCCHLSCCPRPGRSPIFAVFCADVCWYCWLLFFLEKN